MTVDGVSGTSAGAMNAAVFAHGHLCGGADGAKAALEQFWRRVSKPPPSVHSSERRLIERLDDGRSTFRPPTLQRTSWPVWFRRTR